MKDLEKWYYIAWGIMVTVFCILSVIGHFAHPDNNL